MVKWPAWLRPQDAVLVTGASGFIGAKVVDSLLEYGCENVRTTIPFVELLASQETLSLPMFPELSDSQIHHVVAPISDFFARR